MIVAFIGRKTQVPERQQLSAIMRDYRENRLGIGSTVHLRPARDNCHASVTFEE